MIKKKSSTLISFFFTQCFIYVNIISIKRRTAKRQMKKDIDVGTNKQTDGRTENQKGRGTLLDRRIYGTIDGHRCVESADCLRGCEFQLLVLCDCVQVKVHLVCS